MSGSLAEATADPRRTESPEGTQSLGAGLAAALAPGDVVALSGPLGSGKTCFVAGLARGLGAPGRVRSPSFTLVNEYTGRIVLLHLDLFRLEPRAVPGLGIEELVERGAVAVEWAERLPSPWLAEALEIHFIHAGDTFRTLVGRARAGRGLELLEAWRRLPDAARGSAA